MLLAIRTNPFSKAGKQGLIAIQKQVTKKGKTFTQTFYVKPDSLPKRLTPPMAVASIALPGPSANPTVVLENGDTFESNRPEGGFYIPYEDKVVRIPDKLIERVVKLRGQTFILHRELGRERFTERFCLTELTSGLRVTNPEYTPMETVIRTESLLNSYTDKEVAEKIARARDIMGYTEVVVDTDDWSVEEARKVLTDEEMTVAATEILNDKLEGEDGPFTVEDVVTWLKDSENVETNRDLRYLEDFDEFILEEAITNRINYESAEMRNEAISQISTMVGESETHYGTDVEYHEVAEWAEKYENNLVDGWSEYDYGTDYEHGETAWSVADVVAYAVGNDMSLASAQGVAEEDTERQDVELQGDDILDLSFTSAYDVHWDGDALETLGDWTGGTCKATRDAASALDDCRREKISDECHPSNEIVRMIENHMMEYQGGVLYRGTGNPAWLTSEIGDTVVVGTASFTKNETTARGFSGIVMLIMEPAPKGEGNPIKGVDIIGLIEDAREEGFHSEHGFATYPEEQEFAVRAPALKILRREGNRVWVQPVEMDLLEVMKSLFETKAEREAAMARTFDHHMRDDTEDKWT